MNLKTSFIALFPFTLAILSPSAAYAIPTEDAAYCYALAERIGNAGAQKTFGSHVVSNVNNHLHSSSESERRILISYSMGVGEGLAKSDDGEISKEMEFKLFAGICAPYLNE